MPKFLPAGMLIVLLKIATAQAVSIQDSLPCRQAGSLSPARTEKARSGGLRITAGHLVWKENGTGIANEWILFSKEFSSALNGKQPLLVVTAVCRNEGFTISELTDKGFIIKKGHKNKTEHSFRFTWQAELPAR